MSCKRRICSAVSFILVFVMVLALCAYGTEEETLAVDAATAEAAPVAASLEEPSAEASVEAEAPVDPLKASEVVRLDAVTIAGETTGGSFYVYAPAVPHDYDMLSNFLNGLIFVYPDKPVANETEVLALLENLGLTEIAENFPAYIVVPVPMNGETWTEADLDLYYEAQFYMAGGEVDAAVQPPAGEYNRHTMNSLQYVIAEGSGATFVNNVLSQNASRIAGILTFGGEMDDALPTGLAVPAYLVNPCEEAVAYWKTANGVDTEDGNTSYNSAYVQKKVILAEGGASFDKENVQTAWTDLLSRTMRLAVAANLVITTTDMSEWVLMDWLELDDIGLNLYSFEFDAATGEAEYYDEYKTKSINSVHVYVPEGVEADPNTAVPLLFTLHGGSDDPLNIVVGCGWAQKAVDENFIIVSPSEESPEYLMAVYEYVCSRYNIDTSRVYCTGFSMGGMGTALAGKTYPDIFAAIAPMGSAGGNIVDSFDSETYDLPVSMLVGGADDLNVTTREDGAKAVAGMVSGAVEQNFTINEIDPGEPDYDARPYWGYTTGEFEVIYDKDLEWQITNFYKDGYENPLVQCVTLVGAGHSNADYMATVAWDFMSVFARGEDGSLLELE